MAKTPGLFDVDERLQRLSDTGGQLEAFAAVVDFEMFRPELDAALGYGDGARGGQPPFDPVMMFMWMPPVMQGVSEQREHVIGCVHVSVSVLIKALLRTIGDCRAGACLRAGRACA